MNPSTRKTELQPSTQLRKVVFRGSLYINLLAGLMIASLPHRAFAQWYIDNSAAASHLGGKSRLGPYNTEAEAKAVIAANAGYGMRLEAGGKDVVTGSTSGGVNPPAIDYEAERTGRERLAREKAEAVAAAERIERERLAEEKRKKEKDAEFIRDRDAAAATLKGSSGTAASQLKGLSGTDNSGLKGSGFDTGNTDLKELRVTVSFAHAGMPAMPEIPVALPDRVRQPLIVKRQPLALRKLALIEEGKAFNQNCANVVKGSSEHQRCLAQQKQFKADVQALSIEMDTLADEIEAAVRTHTIKSMNALAKRLPGWSADEQARLDKVLNSLASDGDPANSAQIIQAWDDVLARGQGGDFALEATQGEGPGFPGAGTQSFNDCAIFALANAAGLPYGVVAARATKLIGEGEWRDAAERAKPQKAIEQKGLWGGEVVMLAEAFGQVEVVRSSDFAKTLKEGRPVMVNVVPEDGNVRGGHEVVLTRAFQHGGETWYEMMDSNQGPQRRLYLSAKELNTMLQENGVAFSPEPGTTPKLLR